MRASPLRLALAGAIVSLLLVQAKAALATDSSRVDGQEPDYENPVRDSVNDEIRNLPGLNDAIDFKQYSGYLQADASGRKFLHYWFVESQSDPAKDPVVLWLNGGPGCSSLGGLFTELGPFQVKDDGRTLKLNEFSWNKVANVLFLESPAGVGFSYSTSLFDVNTDDSTARMNHAALKAFFRKFPQFKSNSLFLSGESYAGVYLPTLGVLADADPELNLRGIAIGNGYLDVAKLSDSLMFFAYYHGLIGKTTWDRISAVCCDGRAPARENCQLSGRNASMACLYLLREITESYQLIGINPYNIYSDCAGSSAARQAHRNHLSRDQVDRRLLALALDPFTHQKERPFSVFDTREGQARSAGAGGQHDHHQLGLEPPCVDEHLLVSYLNQPDVRAAIHVPARVPAWDTCAQIAYVVKYPALAGGLSPQIKALMGSRRRLALLVYNGDVDAVCNFLGDEWFVDDLGRRVIADYRTWKVGKQVAGYVKHYDGITFATVRGSGHMVPGDRPREALQMLKVLLNSTSHNVLL